MSAPDYAPGNSKKILLASRGASTHVQINIGFRGLSDWAPGVKLLLLSSTPESYVVPVGYSLLFAVGAWAAA